ncbi:response regulator receiver protein [Amycolatopsis sp. H20-H5]|uniref:response regulator receiver protein n=1 Tax=Amycolatopsis sp. H20-H5 TaxID=3046309 RepID=UPI002DB7A3D7|nr:response regulator receiver protein [Amycolatopsis sp. H20-H5]MEC3976807.1 response regulator receiver protein [Amycolatopsis sp. H20-H5]
MSDFFAGTALCGFRRCQTPLPPPGPRGGRPYEFCPDRVWPGGKTCKQLAAAEQALREALGDTEVPTALEDAGEAFARAASGVTEPLQTLSNALDTITGQLQKDIALAVAQAETAERRATDADQGREASEARASAAEQARHEADEQARQAEQAKELAEVSTANAVLQCAEAELAQARAEAAAAAISRQAEKSAAEWTAERAKVSSLTADLATCAEELAVRTAERDAERTTLSDLRKHSGELERALTGQNTHLGAELGEVKKRLRGADDQYRALLEQHQASEAAQRESISAQRADLARQEGQLSAAALNAVHLQRRADDLATTLSTVHEVVLSATDEAPGRLRDQLLATLLVDHAVKPEDSRAANPVVNVPAGDSSDGESPAAAGADHE